ncbi:hypothetical protein SH528x_003015 [Novipirellula sp. SH528]|uniref:hypothetical protein n=1 Tax=Novipirellula sp. SH528 TaxID=3454466 RepID=UPI003F9F701F
MLILAYVAVCCTTYIYSNLWFGTLVVVATIFWLGSTTLYAFSEQSRFSLGFSLAGWAWLVFWLGFYAETPAKYPSWPVPQWIYKAATPFQWQQPVVYGYGRYEEYQASWNHTPYGHMHSLHVSRQLNAPSHLQSHIPSWYNAIRLAVCLSALIVGIIGGATYSRLPRTHQMRGREVIEAES